MQQSNLDIKDLKPLQTFILCDVPVELRTIDEACERLYCDTLAEVEYLILSEDGREKLTKEVVQDSEDSDETRKIVKLINHTTGQYMDIFVSDRVSAGTILFGTCEGRRHNPFSGGLEILLDGAVLLDAKPSKAIGGRP